MTFTEPGSNWDMLTQFVCQQSYENGGFSEEDEMIGKIGPVIIVCRECAGPEIMPSSRGCASHECGILAQSQKGRETVKRYTRATNLFNNRETTALIKCCGQIYFLK